MLRPREFIANAFDLVTLKEAVAAQVKAVDGVVSVQRVVCGGCLDFKIIVSLDASKFGSWEEAKFAPEADFLAAIEKIDGVTQVETQTFTLATL